MYRNRKISLCFPCRNEAKNLKAVLSSVPSIVDEVIVISNKSTDDTVKVARDLGVVVIEDNRTIDGIGYGFAHMSGIEAATGDIIVGADCDGTYPVEEIQSIIDHMIEDKLDFVSCNRYPLQNATQIPLLLRFGVGLLDAEVKILYGKRVRDILSGMWVFDSKIKDQLQLTMGEWNLSPQIKLNAATNPNIVFGQYSIAQHRRLGDSHQHYFKTGSSHLIWILKNRFTSQQATQPTYSELSEVQTEANVG